MLDYENAIIIIRMISFVEIRLDVAVGNKTDLVQHNPFEFVYGCIVQVWWTNGACDLEDFMTCMTNCRPDTLNLYI